jgi:hypothetical protein
MMNMSEGKGGVITKTLTVNGQSIEIHYCAYIYPTETASKNAWERAEKRKKKGDHFSVFRQFNPANGNWLVIAISESNLPQVRTVRRIIAIGGQPYEPEDEQLKELLLRRARVISSSPGPVTQKGRYGGATGGAVIDDDGFLHPRKRPQG